MTTAEIISIVRKKALESSEDIIDDATILIYANLAYGDVIKRAFPNSAVETATVTFTDGVGALPGAFGTLYTDAYDSNTNIFPEVSISDFIRNLAAGENAVTIENGEIKVSPASTSSLTIKYWPTFETLAIGTNPTIDTYLHEPIVYGTLLRVMEDLQDSEMAQFYTNKYEKMVTDRTGNLSNYEEDSQRGNVMFNGIDMLGNGNNYNPDRW